jgi:hypothetical protein
MGGNTKAIFMKDPTVTVTPQWVPTPGESAI